VISGSSGLRSVFLICYGYPKGIINPIRKLTRFPAKFKAPTTSGLFAFDYELSAEKPIRIRGASGGIVVDRKTEKIVGILNETTETTALAVPVQTLANFVGKVQPFLAQKLFPSSTVPEVSPLSVDLYPKFVPSHADMLQQRAEEPPEIRILREKAQHLADSIRNFIAVQSFAWGSGDKEPAAQARYEIRVIDGVQLFRTYPNGERESERVQYPRLNGWVLPADEWSKLPKMVGTEFRLKVHQGEDVVVKQQRMKVFQYYASVEDNLCPIAPVEDFFFFTVSKSIAVACYGEVWTDEDTNILRISEHLDLSDKLKAYRGWEDCYVVLTYGWLNQAGEPRRLVPLTILTEARQKKHTYWCRGYFTDYHTFVARARFIAQ
jgi:hypothetical protein